jgi:hypothetical protein
MSGRRPDPDKEKGDEPLVDGYPPDAYENDGYPTQPVSDGFLDEMRKELGITPDRSAPGRPPG